MNEQRDQNNLFVNSTQKGSVWISVWKWQVYAFSANTKDMLCYVSVAYLFERLSRFEWTKLFSR